MNSENRPPRALIHSLSRAELTDWITAQGQPAFRANQLWQWLYVKHAADWQTMSNLPAPLRGKLADSFDIRAGQTQPDAIIGEPRATRKFIMTFRDGESVEAVLIPTERRCTVCISSQAGCRYRCAFCASGQHGFQRNLEAGEMIAQVLCAGEMADKPLTHVVFMGIGEPLENYEHLLKAVRILNDDSGLCIGARRITISTCGLVPGIERLSQEGLQVELSISLHAPDDRLRNRLMPVNQRYPLTDLIPACKSYFKKTGRIITFEYVMIQGLNDQREHARQLAALARKASARINLIPLNPVREFDGHPSSRQTIEDFMQVLESAGINVTVRESRGCRIRAACGQLRYGKKVSGGRSGNFVDLRDSSPASGVEKNSKQS